MKEAKSVLEKQGVVVEDITHTYDLPDNTRTLTPEFHRDMNHFLSTVRAATDIHTLHDIVTFNRADPRRNLNHGLAIDKFMALFETYNLDAIVTTKITGYPPVGGLPSIIIPAKALTDTNPMGTLFIGKPFEEATILPLAHRYEQKTSHRMPPKP